MSKHTHTKRRSPAKRPILIKGLALVRKAVAKRLRREGVREMARLTKLPLATVSKRSREPESIGLDELSLFCGQLGATVSIVVDDEVRWEGIDYATTL